MLRARQLFEKSGLSMLRKFTVAVGVPAELLREPRFSAAGDRPVSEILRGQFG